MRPAQQITALRRYLSPGAHVEPFRQRAAACVQAGWSVWSVKSVVFPYAQFHPSLLQVEEAVNKFEEEAVWT
jgi:hypothetical protein